MKVIELLTKIANGEEVPKVIKSEGHYYNYNELEKDYYEGMGYDYEYLLKNISINNLNDEVEIIEEDKPFNERVEEIYNRHIDYIYDKEDRKIEKLREPFLQEETLNYVKLLKSKINELIDYINKEK